MKKLCITAFYQKKKQARHITNISELLGIIAYAVAGCVIIGVNLSRQTGGTFMYILSTWMLGSALYVLVSRIGRINVDSRFDRSMRGDLAHAISIAAYQVRISGLMRWNVLPIGILTFLTVSDGRKSVWLALGILLFFVLVNYAGGWEHRIYKRRKRELEILQYKLEKEDQHDLPS